MKMKIILILLISLLNNSCKRYGYVYSDKEDKPIEGILVIDLKDISNKTYTDKNGKFSFNDCGSVIIEKKGYQKDTLKDYGCKPNPDCFNGKIFYMKKE